MNLIYKITYVIFLLLSLGCRKAVKVPPPVNNLVNASVYASNATAISAVTGIFEQMMESPNFFGSGNDATQTISSIAGVSADEFDVFGGSAQPLLSQAYSNALSSQVSPFPFWNILYSKIYSS